MEYYGFTIPYRMKGMGFTGDRSLQDERNGAGKGGREGRVG